MNRDRAGLCGTAGARLGNGGARGRRARPHHVALFLPSLDGGGEERMMLHLAGNLIRRGAAVDLILARAEGPLLAALPAGVRLADLRADSHAASLAGLLHHLRRRRERPDALLATLQAAVPALLAKRFFLRDLRTIVRYASTFSRAFADHGHRKRAMLTLLKRLLPHADAVVAVSSGAADDLMRAAPAAAHLVRTAPNPVVTPDVPARADAPVEHRWFHGRRAPVLVAAGRLVRSKDYPTLLRAFAEVAAARDVRLVALGEGPEREPLAALARRLDVAGRVDFPGWVANPLAYLARADAFVLSSAYEGCPTVLIEAMACGTPVVSTDCPHGPREILAGGRYGRLAPPGDWRALAAAIRGTLDAPADPGTAIARAHAWTVEASVDRHVEILNPGQESAP